METIYDLGQKMIESLTKEKVQAGQVTWFATYDKFYYFITIIVELFVGINCQCFGIQEIFNSIKVEIQDYVGQNFYGFIYSLL